MKIEDVKYTFDQYGYPFLEFQMDGQPVKLSSEQLKRSVLELGYVSFGLEWIGKLPRIEVPPQGENNSGVISAGVQDAELAQICLKFHDDVDAGRRTPSD